MKIYYLTSNKKAKLDFPKTTVEIVDFSLLKKHKPLEESITYVDVTSSDIAELKKIANVLSKNCMAWGFVDAKNILKDPAQAFFLGASDYISAYCIKNGLDKKRFKNVIALKDSFSKMNACEKVENKTNNTTKIIFPGWNKLKTGTKYSFYFLYVSVSAQVNLKTLMGEKIYRNFRDKVRAYMQQTIGFANPLLWMETDTNSLYLLAPEKNNVEQVVKACIKTLLASPMVSNEFFGLNFPLFFTFALHYGQTDYALPGKTGTVVSDAINFVFHLGSKFAQSGRISISENAIEDIVPKGLEDLVEQTEDFEGRKIFWTKKFIS